MSHPHGSDAAGLPPHLVLSVPVDTVRLTAKILQSMSGMEACCFWFGNRNDTMVGSVGSVEAIIIPRQENHRGHYHVTPEAMLRVAAAVRRFTWKNLAQIHSHPGPGVQHSGYDDEMANSRRALSLVFPDYGYLPGVWRCRGWLWRLWPKPFPSGIGVHAFMEGRWKYLSDHEATACLTLTGDKQVSLLDLR